MLGQMVEIRTSSAIEACEVYASSPKEFSRLRAIYINSREELSPLVVLSSACKKDRISYTAAATFRENCRVSAVRDVIIRQDLDGHIAFYAETLESPERYRFSDHFLTDVAKRIFQICAQALSESNIESLVDYRDEILFQAVNPQINFSLWFMFFSFLGGLKLAKTIYEVFCVR
jgi:hypothetical protein